MLGVKAKFHQRKSYKETLDILKYTYLNNTFCIVTSFCTSLLPTCVIWCSLYMTIPLQQVCSGTCATQVSTVASQQGGCGSGSDSGFFLCEVSLFSPSLCVFSMATSKFSQTGKSKLPAGVSVSWKGWLCLCGPATNWQLVLAVIHTSPNDSWDGLQRPTVQENR